MSVVYVLSGTTFTAPGDWPGSGQCEVIAGGASGWSFNDASAFGVGAGAGAYSKTNTVTASNGASLHVGAGGTTEGQNGGDTWFNGASLAASSCGAKGGTSDATAGGTGGAAAIGIGDVKHSGGNGASSSGAGASGGGGAAGPNGDGGSSATANGGNFGGAGGGGAGGGASAVSPTSGTGSSGGNNHLGTGGGAAATAGTAGGGGGGGTFGGTAAGGNGGSGTEWDSSHGAGGGGGGASGSAAAAGGNGGLYGGGGAGGGGPDFGTGAQGIIVLTYTPSGGSPAPFVPNDTTQTARKRTAGQIDGLIPNLLLGTLALLNSLPPIHAPIEAPVFSRHFSGQTDLPPNGTLYRLAPAQKTPFNTRDFAEQARKGRSGQQTEYVQNVTVGLPVSAAIVQQRTPVITPVFRRTWTQTDPDPNLVLTSLAQSTAPFTPTWLTDQGKRQTLGGQTDLAPNPILTRTLTPPVIPRDFGQTSKRKADSVDAAVNTLLNTLPPSQALVTPFSLRDWPYAQRKPLVQDTNVPNTLAFIAPTNVTTAVQRATVLSQALRKSRPQTDVWPNLLTWPVANSSPPIGTSLDAPVFRRNTLAGQFTASITYQLAAPPVVPIDTSDLPRRNRYQEPFIAPNIRTLSLVAASAPFVPVDWPVVQRRDSLSGQFSASAFYQLAAAPVVPVETAGQHRRRSYPDADQAPNVLLRALAPVPPPIVLPVDTSEQGRKGRSGQQTEYLQNVTIWLPSSVFVPPFLPLDWPYVVRRQLAQDTEVTNRTILATLSAPLKWVDTAEQPRKGREQQTEYLPNVTIGLPVTAFVAPFTPIEWPFVVRKQFVQETSTVNRLILATLVAPITPVDWPQVPHHESLKANPDVLPNLLTSTLALPALLAAGETIPVIMDDPRVAPIIDNLRIIVTFDDRRIYPVRVN